MDLVIFPAVIGRAQADGDLFEATVEANINDASLPAFDGGGLKVTAVWPVADAGQLPLSRLERLADAHLAGLLEAIASELRKRAGG
jgi:hypothetical protein